MDKRLERRFLRAPLKSSALYADEEHVFKARILNISEGGILLSELPHFPESEILPAAIALVDYPRFNGMPLDELKRLSGDELSRKIYKAKIKIIRSFDNKSNVDLVFIHFVGCEFVDVSSELKQAVAKYVEDFTKNIVYLLSLFESLGKKAKAEELEVLKTIASLLGYDRKLQIPLLRAKVLHDYQSLESL